jgi:hypothetical protein
MQVWCMYLLISVFAVCCKCGCQWHLFASVHWLHSWWWRNSSSVVSVACVCIDATGIWRWVPWSTDVPEHDCFLFFLLVIVWFVPLLVFFCVIRGQKVGLISFFSFGAETEVLLSGLKTYNCRGEFRWFMFLYMYVFISYFIICTVVLFDMSQVKYYSCFFVKFLSVLYVSLCAWILLLTADGFMKFV